MFNYILLLSLIYAALYILNKLELNIIKAIIQLYLSFLTNFCNIKLNFKLKIKNYTHYYIKS